MRIEEFRSLVARIARDVPPEFRDGVVAIDVSPKTLPHPLRGDVYTLGECVPLEWSGSGADLHSRVILYHGSFACLARLGDFNWHEEAWDTLTHELRHHLEWRANVDALAAYDWAAEQNFARREGEPFDPAFYRSGEELAPGVYKVDDDVFVEGGAGSPKGLPDGRGERVEFAWHGGQYRVALPRDAKRPVFVTVAGLAEPPPGDVVVVVRRKPSVWDVWRGTPAPSVLTATAEPIGG